MYTVHDNDALSTSETLSSLPAVNQDDTISIQPPTIHSSANKNQICRESFFCCWAHCLEQSAFVSQIVADSDFGFKHNLMSHFNCAFN